MRSAIFASPEVCIFEVLYLVGDIYTRMTWCHLYRRPVGAILRAAVAASNESAVRVLTAASSVIGGLDAASALSAGLTLATIFKSLVSVCLANVAGATGRRAIVGEWVKPTSRRKSSSPRPPSSPSSWAPCMCRRCMFRMARRGCCRTGGRSRRRRRSAVRRRGCCGSTQRPGWPLRPWWLFNDTLSRPTKKTTSEVSVLSLRFTHQSRRERQGICPWCLMWQGRGSPGPWLGQPGR